MLMMSGGALARCTLFALGVTPYINASIIVQLLTVAIPSLENLAKEPDGQTKLQQITRYAGGIIGLVMSIGYYFVIRNMGALKYTSGTAGIFTAVVIIATFTAGAQLITWCGEQIDDKGIGNGLSLLIFSSIVSNWVSPAAARVSRPATVVYREDQLETIEEKIRRDRPLPMPLSSICSPHQVIS